VLTNLDNFRNGPKDFVFDFAPVFWLMSDVSSPERAGMIDDRSESDPFEIRMVDVGAQSLRVAIKRSFSMCRGSGVSLPRSRPAQAFACALR
jgi:hypothetical protein